MILPKRLLRVSVFFLAAASFCSIGLPVKGQEVQHLTTTNRGGMPGMPIVTGIEQVTNGVRVTWDGPSGYYQLFHKKQLHDPVWEPLGALTNFVRRATIGAIYKDAFFQVAGPAPQYAGAQACSECHENIHNSAMDTRHAQAYESLRQVGQNKNPSCLPCHTVGFALPTGFNSEFRTPHLRGVQCESCHGPAGNHAANENDPLVRPRVEIASREKSESNWSTRPEKARRLSDTVAGSSTE